VLIFSKLISVLKAAPVVMQAESFTEVAKNVTNCTNPYSASLTAVKVIAVECIPPKVKYPIKCTILGLQIIAAVNTGGLSSVAATALTIATATQVLEEMI